MGGSYPSLGSCCSSRCGWDRFCNTASVPQPVSSLDIQLLSPLIWFLPPQIRVPPCPEHLPPRPLSEFLLGLVLGGVCLINATVVCVNVLLLGPITADMLVRDGLWWGGRGGCRDPWSRWAHRIATILQVLLQVWLTGGSQVCGIVFRYVL